MGKDPNITIKYSDGDRFFFVKLDHLWFDPGSKNDPFKHSNFEWEYTETNKGVREDMVLIRVYLSGDSVTGGINWEVITAASMQENFIDTLKKTLKIIEQKISSRRFYET